MDAKPCEQTVTQFQVSQLFGGVYAKVVGMETAINEFRDTGVWAVDNSVFREEGFAPFELLRGVTSSSKQQSKTFQTVGNYFDKMSHLSRLCRC